MKSTNPRDTTPMPDALRAEIENLREDARRLARSSQSPLQDVKTRAQEIVTLLTMERTPDIETLLKRIKSPYTSPRVVGACVEQLLETLQRL